MGYIRHHAIVVTAYDTDKAEKAHREAQEIGCSPSAILGPVTNGYVTFVIPPDGSKEGWDTSDKGDDARADFIEWLDSQRYADGSSPYAWVEVQYGDDNCETKIVAHSDEHKRRRARNA